MTERQAYLCDRSLKISQILGMLYSHDKTSRCRSLAVLADLTNEVLHGNLHISTGSLVEGTSISGSDTDIMVILGSMVAVRSSNDIPSNSVDSNSYFKMDFRRTRAGFCTLPVLELREDGDIIQGLNFKISDLLATYGDETYLTHTRLSNSMVEHVKMIHMNLLPISGITVKNTYWHGPCLSTTFQGIPSRSKYRSGDCACAIVCPYWPDPAMEWANRPRLHGWPSNELIDHLKQMHCHLLPVGDSESRENALEWRFAFVYQERGLLWSFSTIQIQCYVILKALKKVFLDPIFHDEISSFHLKTVMFWLLENEGQDMWTEENLLQCIVLCLENLKECIHKMHLPHFFLRQRNLLFNKFKKAECRREALSVLTNVQENIYHSQTIGVMDLDERFIRAFKTFLHIRMAIQCFAFAQTLRDEHIKILCISLAHRTFKDACGLDGMSGHLYYATFDLVRGETEASIARVLGLFQINRCLYYGSILSRKRKIIVNNGNIIQTDEEPYENINLGSDECVALNVCFTQGDLVCLPDALQYECALQIGAIETNLIIHPVVYSYFLLVTAFQLQGNVEVVERYLDLLEGAVMDTEIGFGGHIGLNLLGFAYCKAGKLKKAFHIFCQSQQEYNSSKNAAVYHLCILIWTFLLEQEAKVA